MMTGGVSDRIQELGWLSLTRGEGGGGSSLWSEIG